MCSSDLAAHTPGPAATEDAPQLCTVCSYELAPALEHTHVWGAWISNGDGTHTRTCAKDGSHTETNACSGGIATCQNSAVCAVCNTAYGAKDMTNHTGGTEVRGSVEATTSTEGSFLCQKSQGICVGHKESSHLRGPLLMTGFVNLPICLENIWRFDGGFFGRSEEHTSELQSLV